jgi:hypothetical protein
MQEAFARLPVRLLNDGEIPDKGKSLYLLLDRHLNKRTGQCDPARTRLAALLNCSGRWVTKLLALLEKGGYIRVQRGSGGRNFYELLGGGEWGTTVPHSDEFTGELQFQGVGNYSSPPPPILPYSAEKEQGNKKATPTPSARAPKQPEPDLFHTDHHLWLKQAASYAVGAKPDDPKLAALAPWFPQWVADFFLLRGWKQRTDSTNVGLWAGQFALIGAGEGETRAAGQFVLDNPPRDRRGDERFSKDDIRRAIITQIHEQRRVAKLTAAPAAAKPIQVDPAEQERREAMLQRVRETRF